MRNDIKLDGWVLTTSGVECDQFLESVFFTGSGRMGSRGCMAFRREERALDAGLFVSGIFDRISGGSPITDFVALPSPLWCDLELDGRDAEVCSPVTRTLNLRTGELRFEYTVEAGPHQAKVMERRVFPMDSPGQVFQRFTVKSDCPASLKLGIDARVSNCPIPDDQVKENIEIVRMFRETAFDITAQAIEASYETRHTGLKLIYRMCFNSSVEGVADGKILLFTGRSLAVESVCNIYTSRDVDPRLSSPLPNSTGYGSALDKARDALDRRWRNCNVVIDGDSEAQNAIRYVIYQLLANCPARDGTVSIGARGLTHTRYKGCCFWDTEMFLLPFYTLTDPEAARNLLNFRVKTLPAAREHVKKMNGSGARYPWMVSLDGSEQCESWDIGCSEVHVTADVAYAAGQYLDWSGDTTFFLNGGAEMLVETARFWPSRYSPAPNGGVNLLFCKGPDEYCGITSNNLYTNFMVRHNIALASSAADTLSRLDPVQYARLALSAGEVGQWRTLSAGIKFPRDNETGRWMQDDTFHLLQPVDVAQIKPDDSAAYSRVCFDALQRLKVIKQADVLLLMTRLPELFTEGEKLAAWEDFEPLCIHDSTLSFATHALFAAQNGLLEDASRYFSKALLLDLRDIMSNTGKEGLHLACLGETWQTVVFGFAGLHLENGKPALAPHLPEGWNALEFPFCFKGRRYVARVTRDGAEIEAGSLSP
ncbi:MAG TPA: glycoside hydrolase family 65 protein [Candidatus Scatomorpha merdigallinarum]|nr:glycoside hydrolase family 65 protein [Candidatus Scatomorpha merdigallinarum]